MEQTNHPHQVLAPQRPLLRTKLVMPRQRPAVLVRQRLLDHLNQAVAPDGKLTPKLTLINGPAGYGKTTLTIQWVSQLNFPIAWLSIDTSDNDEARFLAYLFAAIGTVHEEIGETAMARLTTTYIYNDTEAILIAFLNDLAMQDQPILLVLDDYHLITNPAVHQAITFLIQHMPVQLHLVITSRNVPPLSLSLLRARGTLSQVNTQDLRFTPSEASQFLSHTMGVSLTQNQITQLDTQVEGWVTGYQLIALALKESVPLSDTFSGNQRHLVDYLGDQVLDQQPESVQAFLLDTAVLSRFNADLCQQVTGHDCQALLTQVEASNLFLIPLDAERNWYRYHHLFSEFLNGRLHRCRSTADIHTQHRRAAEWFQSHGEPLTALEHALDAQDYAFSTDLIMTVARDVLMFGEGSTLRHWIESLPPQWQTSRRRLQLFYAWALIRTGEFGQAKAVLDAIADQLDTALLWGEWSALRARLAVITGDTDINIRFSQKALHKLPLDQHMLRSEVAINLGISMLQKADITAARQAFAEAAQNTAHDPGLWAVLFATFYWGQTYQRTGDLQDAFQVYQRGLATAEENKQGDDRSPAAGFMHIGLGRILYEWNRLAEAELHFRQATRLAERCGDYKMLIYSREGLADVLVATGDEVGALTIIHTLEQQLQADGITLRRAMISLHQGDLSPMAQWATRLGICVDDPPERVKELPRAYIELARLHLYQRDFAGVDTLLDQLIYIGESRQNLPFLLKARLYQALNYAKQGHMETAVATFQQLLSQAQPGGFVRLFLDTPDPSLMRLLHRAANQGVMAPYAQALLSYLEPSQTNAVIQPLSPREMEVLQYLALGQTNRQIADQMIVSPNTVKAHTRRLYGKLDVRNRTQAVARARELNLL